MSSSMGSCLKVKVTGMLSITAAADVKASTQSIMSKQEILQTCFLSVNVLISCNQMWKHKLRTIHVCQIPSVVQKYLNDILTGGILNAYKFNFA